MKKNITLILTELEETWPKDGVVYFIGEWCKIYSRKKIWNKLSSTTQAYHWNNRKKLRSDFVYLQDLNEKILLELIPILNKTHQLHKDVNYWRLILGYWINIYTAVLFDRWSSVEKLSDCKLKLEANYILLGNEYLVTNDTADFIDKVSNNPFWNQEIFQILLNRKNNIKWKYVSKVEITSTNKDKIFSNLIELLRYFFKLRLSFLINFFKENDKYVLMATYLPARYLVILELMLHQFPFKLLMPKIPFFTHDPSKRKWRLNYAHSPTDFEFLVRKLMPLVMPKSFIEGFKEIVSLSDSLPLPKIPRVIWTSNYHFCEDIFKVWAAQKISSGARLLIGEHGGMGVGLFNGCHSYEMSVAYRYLSTGFKGLNVIPIGNFRQIGMHVNSFNGGHGILVCGIMPRYSFDIRSMMISSQVLNYFDDQFIFFTSLDKMIQNEFIIRLAEPDFGWNQDLRWMGKFPEIKIAPHNKPLWSVAKKCRLFVATYNATAYIESLSLNFPTIIFWNPLHWELNESAKPFFDALEKVGIYHRTPESAALHINKIWGDVSDWWLSSDVQFACKLFCDEYATKSNNILKKIICEIGELKNGFHNVDC